MSSDNEPEHTGSEPSGESLGSSDTSSDGGSSIRSDSTNGSSRSAKNPPGAPLVRSDTKHGPGASKGGRKSKKSRKGRNPSSASGSSDGDDSSSSSTSPSPSKGGKRVRGGKRNSGGTTTAVSSSTAGGLKRSRNWCFTFNNYGQGDIDFIVGSAGAELTVFTYLIFGKEVGENKTPHLQGVAVFKTAKGMQAVKNALGSNRIHLEIARSLPEAIEYCKKDGDYTEIGTPPMTPAAKGAKGGSCEKLRWEETLQLSREGRISEVQPQLQIRYVKSLEHIHANAVRSNCPKQIDELDNFWIWGPSGSGKSWGARERWGDNMFDKPLTKWWDGYMGEDSVLLDDLDPERAKYLPVLIKRWADRYSFPAEIKGSSMQIRPNRIVITSNYSIEQCFANVEDQRAIRRRFKVVYKARLSEDWVEEAQEAELIE